jgi:hypothetical protein
LIYGAGDQQTAAFTERDFDSEIDQPLPGCALGNCTFGRAAMHTRPPEWITFCRSSPGGPQRAKL